MMKIQKVCLQTHPVRVHFVNISEEGCSNLAALTNHLANSPLCGLQALEVIIRLHERVHCRCLSQCAIRSPLFVLLLAFWPESFAHRVCGEVPNTHLVHAMHVHAPLHEEILPPSLHARIFFLTLPVQGLGAVLNVRQEGAEALMADDFQVAEESIVHVLAILEIDTA